MPAGISKEQMSELNESSYRPTFDKQSEIAAHMFDIRDQAKQLRLQARSELEAAKHRIEAMLSGRYTMNTDKQNPVLHYPALLTDIKQHIRQAQTRAMLAVNAELIRLYWEIGQMLDARQKIEGWGAAVIPRLARDIRNELPEVKGFSERNIKRMLAFYREYRDLEFVPQAVAQIEPAEKAPQPVTLFPQELLSALPWGHHLLLMEKIKDTTMRLWYMQTTLTNGWSRNILQMQIETVAHNRQGKTTSNFAISIRSGAADVERPLSV